MEKYGFVYIWYDRKHKRFYIGCRWGNENDGYICSSPWMKRGYKIRPEDFRRRILGRIYTNKKDLLEEEYRWLSKTKHEELGKRYYNLHNHHFGHWSSSEDTKLTVGQKIAASPDRAKNIGLAMRGRKPASHTIEAVKQSLSGRTYEEIYGPEKAKELREKRRTALLGRKHTEEAKKKMGKKSR